jgi:transitional endoplasmic reticulum ATPase
MMKYNVHFVKSPASFDDVVGLEETKTTLRHIASSTNLSIKKTELDLKSISPSVLLYGPTGTGKSLLTAAMAKECEAQFTSIDCYQLLFGCTAWSNLNNTDKVKFLFSEAEKNAPSIIFFEGVDTFSSNSPYLESAFNQLLKEFDKPRSGVMIIGSATKQEEIPWGLFRRFSYKLEVTLPDEVARREIIKIHLINYGAHPEEPKLVEIEDVAAVIEALAKITAGSSGEEIKDVCQRAVVNAIGEFFEHHEKIILKLFNFEIALEEIKQERKNRL